MARECDFREVPCSQCLKRIPFNTLKGHLADDCDHRTVTCNFCHTESIKQFQLEVSSTHLSIVIQGLCAITFFTTELFPFFLW